MKFEMPTSCRACWLSAIESSKDLGLYLSVEGFCDNCENWIQLYKNKKRFVHSLGSIEDLIKIIYDTGATEIVSKNPLKIVAIIRNGRLVVPKIVNIGSNVEKQVVSSMSGAVGSLWYKHAHKCHVINKTEELE